MSKFWDLSTGVSSVLFLGVSSHHLEGAAPLTAGAVLLWEAGASVRGQSGNGPHSCLFPGRDVSHSWQKVQTTFLRSASSKSCICVPSSCPPERPEESLSHLQTPHLAVVSGLMLVSVAWQAPNTCEVGKAEVVLRIFCIWHVTAFYRQHSGKTKSIRIWIFKVKCAFICIFFTEKKSTWSYLEKLACKELN